MDIVNHFSNVTIGGSRGSASFDSYEYNRRQRADAEWNYRERQLARADAQGQRDAAAAAQDESIFSGVRKDLDAGRTTPGSVAYMFPSAIAEIKSDVAGGRLEEANAKVQSLRESADTYNATFRSYAGTKPRNEFENQVALGGLNMSQYRFWNEQVTVDGQVTTLGSLFRDGKAFREYGYGSRLQQTMSKDFVDEYKGTEDADKRMAMSLVAVPVSQGRVTGKDAVEANYVGDYVRREWDSMVEELGVKGATALVRDAMTNRLASATAIDTMNNVRDFVHAQADGGRALDGYDQTRKYLSQIDRGLSAVSGGSQNASDRDRRGYAKLISAIAEGQKIGAVNVDLDNPETRARIDSLWDVYKKCEGYGVPLLVEGTEGGEDMRAAMSDYVTGPSESNFIRRIGNMLGLVQQIVPARADDKTAVANAVVGLRGDLVSACVKRMASGEREDLVLQTIANGRKDPATDKVDNSDYDALVSGWSHTLPATLGLSSDAAAYVAGKLAAAMRTGGGVRPVDVPEVLAAAAFDKDCPAGVQRELRQWYKGNNMVAEVMEPFRSRAVSLWMDKSVGFGFKDQAQANALWASMLPKFATLLENGLDASKSAEAVASRAPYYFPTGHWIMPGIGRVLTAKEYKDIKDRVFSKGKAMVTTDSGDPVDVSMEMLRSTIPQVGFSGKSADLRNVSLPAFPEGGFAEGFPAGAWNSPERRNDILRYFAILKRYSDEAEVLRAAAAKDGNKNMKGSNPLE